jgi:hypothetical protein
MKLVISYYIKEEPNMILFESLDVYDIFINDGMTYFYDKNDYLNNVDNKLNNDLYTLMIIILTKYFGNQYTQDIVDNRLEYIAFFESKFVYNFELI